MKKSSNRFGSKPDRIIRPEKIMRRTAIVGKKRPMLTAAARSIPHFVLLADPEPVSFIPKSGSVEAVALSSETMP